MNTSQGRFTTKRRNMVLSSTNSGIGEDAASAPLAELCGIYWRPIFTFICRRGYAVADAQDLTQDFFLKLLEGNLLVLADPRRGPFRTLLFKALRNFLIDKHERVKTLKRGGNLQFISSNDLADEAPSQLAAPVPGSASWPAGGLFDLQWAAAVAEQALRRLAEEYENRGRGRIFIVLSRYLTADRTEISYAKLSTTLEVPESSVKILLHRLRKRHRAILRQEVSQTLETRAEVDDEIRYFCAAFATTAA